MERLHIKVDDIGKDHFREEVKRSMRDISLDELAKDLQVGVPTLKLILDALQQSVGHDIREGWLTAYTADATKM
jgi:transcriptional accessory protein Tex/SPT6